VDSSHLRLILNGEEGETKRLEKDAPSGGTGICWSVAYPWKKYPRLIWPCHRLLQYLKGRVGKEIVSWGCEKQVSCHCQRRGVPAYSKHKIMVLTCKTKSCCHSHEPKEGCARRARLVRYSCHSSFSRKRSKLMGSVGSCFPGISFCNIPLRTITYIKFSSTCSLAL